ncbi:hypothetical protein HH303_10775 [Rhodospirillaceae bacterium KN72]|uniref:EamA domain-containing protein n=1 Tax=Pacificispira spongiicola TaxID=2729598 RepID=A0A7Y0HFU2_9PROT|nr:hypothetical protein [Pacificispira spongiicola]NMM44963.1 hypothetical protein [Pacificispira spongiicola]
MKKGILVTAGAIASWALLSVVGRILLLRLPIDPWAFSFIQLCTGGAALVVASMLFAAPRASFRFQRFARPTTWILGVLRVASAAIYTTVLGWLSVLETGTIGAVSVPLAALGVWIVFRRRPSRGEGWGHLVILGASGFLLTGLEDPLQPIVAGLMGLNALATVGIALLVERHPDNLSDEPGARLQFTGTVLMVTAAFFLALRAVQAPASETADWDWQLIAVSAVFGIVLRAPSTVLAFWSIRLAGTQNYAAAIAFLPLIGMGFEESAVAIGLIDVSRFDPGTLLIALIVLAGTGAVIATRLHTKRGAAE